MSVLLQVTRQPEYADKDQVDGHDVVEQPWLYQNQDARDQGDERL